MKKIMKKVPVALCLTGSLFLISCADTNFSQSDYYSSGLKNEATRNKSTADRISVLEKKNEALQKELRSTTTRLSSMWSKLEELEQNVRGLAGEVDASGARQEEMYPLLQERIAKLEGEFAILRTNLQQNNVDKNKLAPVSSGQEPEQKGTAEELYKAGLKLFQERKYSLAVARLNTLIKQYPKANLVDNAYFWLGESYYQMQDYKNAILQYEKVIRDYPKSNKAPASYLKQGVSFIRVNNSQVARIRLNDVIDKFPKSQEAVRAKEELKKLNSKK